MDLHTPPPSYEAATRVSGSQNPYFSGAPPSAPSCHDDAIISAPITAPILSQPQRPSSRAQVRPYNPISYPVTRPTPQTNVMLRRQQSQNDNKSCVCYCLTLVVLVVIVFIFVLVAKSGSAKSDYNRVYHQYTDNSGWDDNSYKRRIDESKWNFQTQYNNHNN